MQQRLKLMVVVLVVLMLLTGCGAKMKKESDTKNQDDVSMFVVLEVGVTYKIVYHQETKVMYAISNGGYNSGTFTVMLDADGKPLLYKEDPDEEG